LGEDVLADIFFFTVSVPDESESEVEPEDDATIRSGIWGLRQERDVQEESESDADLALLLFSSLFF
jgi:hypothetical protein